MSRSTLQAMTASERKSTVSLASIYFVRMLGFFMVLPVFALYADHLEGSTHFLVGVAIGIYGLTQAILQIPFGWMSDRIGRKTVITFGLLLFAAGSVVAAMSDHIYGVVLGRALQGTGAVAAAIMALTADLTRDEHRTKAMAVIGMSIGAAFLVALIAGPLVNIWIGVDGIFWLTAILALLAILILHVFVPTPVGHMVHRDTQTLRENIYDVFFHRELFRLDVGIASLHFVLTSLFVVLPLIMRDAARIPVEDHWEAYVPVLLMSVVTMVPFIIYAEKHRRMKPVFVGAIGVLCATQFSLVWLEFNFYSLLVSLWIFFTAFNLLEASLPSLVSKTAPPASKGTAMGVYSTSQFLGAAFGGILGGLLHQSYGIAGVLIVNGLVLAGWLLVAAAMQNPRYLTSQLVHVGRVSEKEARQLVIRLTAIRGVAEAVVIPEESAAYLKVDSRALDEEALAAFSQELSG